MSRTHKIGESEPPSVPKAPDNGPPRTIKIETLIQMEKEGHQLKMENSALKKKLEEVESAFKGKDMETRELEKDLETERGENVKLKREIEEEKEKLSEMTKKFEGKSVELESSEGELLKLKKELDEKEALLENAAKEKSQLESSKQKLIKLKKELEEKEALLDNMESELETSLEPYRKEIKVLESKVKELELVIQNCVDLSQKTTNQILLIANGTGVSPSLPAGPKIKQPRRQPKAETSTSDKLRMRVLAIGKNKMEKGPGPSTTTRKRSRPPQSSVAEAAGSSNPKLGSQTGGTKKRRIARAKSDPPPT